MCRGGLSSASVDGTRRRVRLIMAIIWIRVSKFGSAIAGVLLAHPLVEVVFVASCLGLGRRGSSFGGWLVVVVVDERIGVCV